MNKIKPVKSKRVVKETYSDEVLESMRERCSNVRDLSIIELLISTGVRVGEIVNLNINDVDLEKRECKVLGKGNKERTVYFDAKTKIHISRYLESRSNSNNALFVSSKKPHNRIGVRTIEKIVKRANKDLDVKAHPHKFRRTFATNAIHKGMPIEQVQCLLGHEKIDTTLGYAMVSQDNVKTSRQKLM